MYRNALQIVLRLKLFMFRKWLFACQRIVSPSSVFELTSSSLLIRIPTSITNNVGGGMWDKALEWIIEKVGTAQRNIQLAVRTNIESPVVTNLYKVICSECKEVRAFFSYLALVAKFTRSNACSCSELCEVSSCNLLVSLSRNKTVRYKGYQLTYDWIKIVLRGRKATLPV